MERVNSMTGGNQDQFSPFLYSFFKGIETFESSFTDYKEKASQESNGNGIKEILKEFYDNHDSSVEKLIDNLLPSKYQPVARVVKNWPWSDTVDLTSAMLKEYGKDESGEYKTTGDVFRDIFCQKLREKIFR